MTKGWQAIEIDKLVSANWNYKTDDEELEAHLSENMKRNGQIESIIVRELETGFYEVVNGNHRLKVMRQLGMTDVMTFNLGEISLAAAKRIAVETNETRFTSDNIKLAETLKEISQEFDLSDLLKTMPYTEEEFNRYQKLTDFDFDAFEKDTNGVDLSGGGEASLPDTGEWKKVEFNLPEGVADQLESQIKRFKKALYPEEQPDKVSYVLPIEAMVQCLAQMADDQLI